MESTTLFSLMFIIVALTRRGLTQGILSSGLLPPTDAAKLERISRRRRGFYEGSSVLQNRTLLVSRQYLKSAFISKRVEFTLRCQNKMVKQANIKYFTGFLEFLGKINIRFTWHKVT